MSIVNFISKVLEMWQSNTDHVRRSVQKKTVSNPGISATRLWSFQQMVHQALVLLRSFHRIPVPGFLIYKLFFVGQKEE
jgi:hypothetical protein